MFAVVRTGGKQYRVAAEDEITVEKLEAEEGAVLSLAEVLMLGSEAGVTVGAPLVAGASVEVTVLGQVRGPKVVTLHKRRRKHSSQRKRGHRQKLTRLRVTAIHAPAGA